MSESIASRAGAILRQIRRVRDALSRRVHDTTTVDGRALERTRRVVLASAATVVARVVQGLLALVTVPLALHAYGPDRYGLWMTVSALLVIAALLDQAVGFGLVQGLADASARDDEEGASAQVATYFFGTLALALVLGAALTATHGWIPWARMFAAPPSLRGEVGAVMAAFWALFLANLVVGLVQKIQTGHQEVAANALWQIVGSGFSFAALVAVVSLGLPLPWLVVATMGGPVVAGLIAWKVVVRGRPWLLPRARYVRREVASRGLRTAWLVAGANALMGAVNASDNVIIAHLHSASTVTAFAVPWRLFNVIQGLVALIPFALWPAVREALARGDLSWVRQSLVRTMALLAGGASVAGVGLVLWGGPIVHWWSRGAVRPNPPLLMALAAWLAASAASAAVLSYLAALGALRWQLASAAMLVATVVPAKVALVGSLGPAASPAISAAGLGIFVVVPGWLRTRRMLLELAIDGAGAAARGQDP